jgi:hypothetical protein
LRHYAKSRKVAGSSPDEVIGFFSIDLILPGFTQPLTNEYQELIKLIFLGSKARAARKADKLTAIFEPIV